MQIYYGTKGTIVTELQITEDNPDTIYIDRELVKVIDPDKYLHDKEISYWAVDDDVADNMLFSDYSYSNNKSLQKITTEYLGTIKVQL